MNLHPRPQIRFTFLALLALALFAGVSCSHCPAEKCAAKTPGVKPLKIAYFVGEGGRGTGVIQLGRILSYLPGAKVTLLDGEDLRAGKLKGNDLLVIPGGSSATQYKTMQESGAEAIRRFVADGGAYFGVCAGFHCALNRPERVRLLPYTWYFGGAQMRATLMIEIPEKAAERLDVPAGKYQVKYSRGPISKRCEQPGTGWAEELAVYKNEMPWPKISFDGAPAILFGEYGKGKVVATSFHPEAMPTTWPIALGCIYAVTGRKLQPVLPAKDLDRVSVAYYTGGHAGKTWVAEALALDRQRDLDLVIPSSLTDGTLDHVQVVICSRNTKDAYSKFFPQPLVAPLIKQFLDRGGKLLVSPEGMKSAPKHPNVIELKPDGCIVKAVRAAAASFR